MQISSCFFEKNFKNPLTNMALCGYNIRVIVKNAYRRLKAYVLLRGF